MSFRAAAAGLMLASTGVQADTEGPSLPRVEVVGSRLPRIDGETALPIQIIRREEIDTGARLSRRSSRSSREFRRLGGGDRHLLLGSPASLGRCAASAELATLVMLNGRRIGNYAFRPLRQIGRSARDPARGDRRVRC
jgi:iron complex outermembrane receptor protein